MKRNDAFPSKYLKKEDVERPIVFTIADVRIETLQSDRGEEDKPIMHFREKDAKAFVVNNCNWDTCEQAYGPDTVDWVGKAVELYHDPGVMMGPKRVGGVRLRIPAGAPVPVQQSHVAPVIWPTKDQLIAEAVAVGLTKEALGAMLAGEGRTGFNAARDTELIRGFIAHHKQQNQIVDSGNPADGDIPF